MSPHVILPFLTRFSTKILVIRLVNGGRAGRRILNGVNLRFLLNNLILTDVNETLYIYSLYEDLAWNCVWGRSHQGQGITFGVVKSRSLLLKIEKKCFYSITGVNWNQSWWNFVYRQLSWGPSFGLHLGLVGSR